MQVEQTHFGPDRAELYDDLDEHKVLAIVDKLVPASERGIEGNTVWECMGV